MPQEKMDNAFRRAKLAKFIEIESYESFEKLAVGRNYSCRLSDMRVRCSQ
jgi:hypothetical protein